jgi:hypothetical protein
VAVLVDTNVIADVLYSDPVWCNWATEQLALHAGDLFINPLIYAELCYPASSPDEVNQVVESLGFQYVELPRLALFLAAQAYRAYRVRGGMKTAPLPDFFIGAHAEASGMTLLTRDKSRYTTYFPSARLICP